MFKNIGKKMMAVMAAAALILTMIPASPVHAAEIYPGFYSVTVVPTYQNPDTGAIDDVGQNPGIGNMMVQAQVQPVGYVEIEEDGTIWLNTRWNQADANIYAGFETSSDGSQTWTQRPFEVTNQMVAGNYEFMGNTFDATVTDYRFQLDSLNDTIRCTNYVEAMDRECIWFCYITDLREGVGDEWSVVQPPNMTDYTESLSQAESASSPSSAPAAAPSVSGGSAPAVTNGAGTPAPADKKGPEIKERKVADAQVNTGGTSADQIVSGEGLDDSTGIVGLGTGQSETESKKDEKSSEKATGKFGTAQMIFSFIGGCIVGGGVVGAAFYLSGRKKKQYTDLFADVDEDEDINEKR